MATAKTPQEVTTDYAVDTKDTPLAAVGPQTPEALLYGDHLAQKFGNTPSNPKHAGDLSESSVLLIHTNNNMDGSVGNAHITVPKEMVGDYCRAGWAIAGPMDRAQAADQVGPGSGATPDKDGAKAEQFTADVAAGKEVVDTPAA